jgi:2'-hydroxyisoflavone reductase
MKILVIGGTKFVGRHFVEAALDEGHEITLLNRQQTNPQLFPGVERIKADRRSATFQQVLKDRKWDAVVDTCAYNAEDVQLIPKKSFSHYTLISTISVYANMEAGNINENHQVIELLPQHCQTSPEYYGASKAEAEKIANEAFPESSFIVRPGLIVGAYDQTRRFIYWLRRINHGGKILAPGKPERPIQFIDCRDLAEWILFALKNHLTGTYNAVGHGQELTMQKFLDKCKQVINNNVEFIWLSDKSLLDNKITPWSEMPLWLPESDNGFLSIDASKALANGLKIRNLESTIHDTWLWDKTDNQPDSDLWLTRKKEQELLTGVELWQEYMDQIECCD